MTARSSFIESTIQCPLCTLSAPLKYANAKVYTVAERESDKRAVSYRWLEDYDDSVIPHYYSVWMCHQCYFANFVEDVLTPSGIKENYLREAFTAIPGEKMGLLSIFHDMIPDGELDFAGAVAKHLTGLFICLLPEEGKIDHNKLARLYLRIAWLYREAKMTSSPAGAAPGAGASSGLNLAIGNLDSQVAVFKQLIVDLNAASDLETKGGTNPYSPIIRSFALKLNELMGISKQFKDTVASTMDAASAEKMKETMESSSDLQTKLLELRKDWPELPMSEQEALHGATAAFIKALTVDQTYRKAEQALGVMTLIVDLLRRNNEPIQALEFIENIAAKALGGKAAMTDKMIKMKSGDGNTEDMSSKLGAFDTAAAELLMHKREIHDELFEKHKAEVDAIIEGAKDKTENGLKTLLHQKEVSPYVMEELLNRGYLKGHKKGLFG
jgi:hypothetical protein